MPFTGFIIRSLSSSEGLSLIRQVLASRATMIAQAFAIGAGALRWRSVASYADVPVLWIKGLVTKRPLKLQPT